MTIQHAPETPTGEHRIEETQRPAPIAGRFQPVWSRSRRLP